MSSSDKTKQSKWVSVGQNIILVLGWLLMIPILLFVGLGCLSGIYK